MNSRDCCSSPFCSDFFLFLQSFCPFNLLSSSVMMITNGDNTGTMSKRVFPWLVVSLYLIRQLPFFCKKNIPFIWARSKKAARIPLHATCQNLEIRVKTHCLGYLLTRGRYPFMAGTTSSVQLSSTSWQIFPRLHVVTSS